MIAHADKYSAAFSKEATNGRYPKVSFADFEAGKFPEKDAWLYSSFWYKDFDGMAYKTMLRQLISKWGIMSIDMQEAVSKDMAFINEDGSADYVESEIIDAPAQDVTGQPEAPQADNLPPMQENPQEEPKAAANDGNLF
jgi:recombination protein RecT